MILTALPSSSADPISTHKSQLGSRQVAVEYRSQRSFTNNIKEKGSSCCHDATALDHRRSSSPRTYPFLEDYINSWLEYYSMKYFVKLLLRLIFRPFEDILTALGFGD